MKAAIKTAFGQEMSLARDAYERDQLDEAFRLLERAHILGQRYFTTHFITHWWMLKVGIRKTDWREIRGQILRIIAVIPGYLFGWVPKGNTGGADVSALKPMPIPDDLATPLKGYNVWTDVLLRVLVWPVVALLVWFGMFAWSTYVRAGETRNIVSAFDGTCSPLVGFEGPEDLVWDREAGTVYAVGGDRRSFRSGGPGRAKIWSLPMASPDLAVPNDLAPAQPEIFRSFGMDLHIDEMGTRRLFVANRPSDGHTIEVFRVTASGDLLLERTLKHPLLRNPNDLVAIGPTEALVTLDKKADAATLGEIFEGARQLRTGKVLRINTETAEYVAEDLRMANGIRVQSWISIDAQINAHAETWLDRAQSEGISFVDSRFSDARKQRQMFLRREGILNGESDRLSMDARKNLRLTELTKAGEAEIQRSSREYKTLATGEDFKGTFERTLDLAQGRMAIIGNQKAFALVPWRPDLEQRRGRSLQFEMRARGIEWTMPGARRRGLSR